MEGRGKAYSRLKPEDVERVLGELDIDIFRLLPLEGEMLGKYHPLFTSAKHLTTQLNEPLPSGAPRMTANQVGTRLSLLKVGGFVVPIIRNVSNRIEGWQKTQKAVEYLERLDGVSTGEGV